MRARTLRSTAAVVALCAVAAALAGCATLARWVDARKARKGPFTIVSPAVAFELTRDSPTIYILDLRSAEDFQGPTGHLRNAFNIPLARLPYRLLEMRAFHGETILVYCNNDDCGLAGMKTLKDSGFQAAMLIRGGMDGWLCGGFPTYIRTGTLIPANARLKPEKYVELEPDSLRPKYEVPVMAPAPKVPCQGR